MKKYCGSFNASGGCSNKKSNDGCVDSNGVVMRHGCNIKMSGGNYCGSKHHSANEHA